MATPLSVFSVSEYHFCKRAGMIAVNQSKEEEEDNENFRLIPLLSYSPCFTIVELQKQLEDIRTDLTTLVLGNILVLLLALGFFLFGSTTQLMLLALCFCLSFLSMAMRAQRMIKLQEELRIAEDANSLDLNHFERREQHVSWWSLLKSDWAISSVYTEALFHKEFAIAGKPSKVLYSGGSAIPVIVRRQDPCETKENHRVRLALYAVLIEYAEKRKIEWGLLLFAKTKKGILIPIDDRDRNKAKRIVEDFRVSIARFEEPEKPFPSKCFGCPWGKPTTESSETLRDHKDEKWIAKFKTKFRSPCGDHFQWIPPHRAAINMRLVDDPNPERRSNFDSDEDGEDD